MTALCPQAWQFAHQVENAQVLEAKGVARRHATGLFTPARYRIEQKWNTSTAGNAVICLSIDLKERRSPHPDWRSAGPRPRPTRRDSFLRPYQLSLNAVATFRTRPPMS